MSINGQLSLELEKAQQIIDKHFPTEHQSIVNLVPLQNHGYSYTPDSRTYVLDLQKVGSSGPPTISCFITISRPTVDGGIYHQNSLSSVANLLNLIRNRTDIPIRESTLDTSSSLVPFHYLLSPVSPFPSKSIVSLPQARRSGLLSETAKVSIDLLLGKFLGQLHSGVQNDWYGLPQEKPIKPSYSWQETFTSLLEELLGRIESNENEYGLHLSFQQIRLYLSRAIGSFLFDDVEVPSLVWFTGSEHDIYITLPSPSSLGASSYEPGTIAAILPNLAHALWGDPLLESFMMGPEGGKEPTEAFIEGYKGGGGGTLLVFARPKTKRIWYTLFLALLVLTKYGPRTVENQDEPWILEQQAWAKETLDKCIMKLKDAPCY